MYLHEEHKTDRQQFNHKVQGQGYSHTTTQENGTSMYKAAW